MSYKFALENNNYEDFSSGRVFYNQKGTTSFPVRLASEIYLRCVSILASQGILKPYVIYDPCCGGAYLLSSLGYLHSKDISKIYGSDINEIAVALAQKNLSLLSREGLEERISQIEKMIADFDKESHKEALQSALKLKRILENRAEAIEIRCFNADITKDTDLGKKIGKINIVITDLPYGEIVNWSDMQKEEEAINKLMENVYPVLAKNSVIAIVSRKKTKIRHEKYKKIEQFTVGKRQITILQPVIGSYFGSNIQL